MPISNLFKPKIKNSDSKVRIEALKDIEDQNVLADIVINDPCEMVKKEAVSRIKDLNTLKRVLFSGNKKRKLPEPIVNSIFNEIKNKKLLKSFFVGNASFKGITEYFEHVKDKNILIDVLSVTNNKNIALKAITRLDDIQIPLTELRKKIESTGNRIAVRELHNIIIRKYDDEIILKEIISAAIDPKTVISALKKISAVPFLEDLLSEEQSKNAKKYIKNRLKKLRPDYMEFKVQMDCGECGFPVMVNGPLVMTKCNSCGAEVNVGSKYWKNLFKRSESSGVFVMGQRIGPKPGKLKSPRCHKCEERLPVKDVVLGKEDDIVCVKCGTVHSSFPPPQWMKRLRNENNKRPAHIFCAEREGQVARKPAREAKPIAFNCINCSSPLKFTVETPRVMECEHCSTQQYLPDGLWHSLHPVKRVKPWYILFK
ncbi:hypothetical protein ACFL20_09155 [Spirochaetota bacterium]